jgi:hypothetical protein
MRNEMKKELMTVIGFVNGEPISVLVMATSTLQAMRLAREQNEGFTPKTAWRNSFTNGAK